MYSTAKIHYTTITMNKEGSARFVKKNDFLKTSPYMLMLEVRKCKCVGQGPAKEEWGIHVVTSTLPCDTWV